MSVPQTFWNGVPAKATRVRVVVGDSPRSTWWCASLAGTEREAVEVDTGYGLPFYLDNHDGSGWEKVTTGLGSPQRAHRSLPVERVVVVRDDR